MSVLVVCFSEVRSDPVSTHVDDLSFGSCSPKLTSAGGMTHFSNHWGLAADNLKNVEVGRHPLPCS
jgi:hypothetical protein